MMPAMSPAAQNPVFFAYAVSTVVLSLNILVLWNMSGGVRNTVKKTLNPEDAKAFGSNLVQEEPAEIARVLRAHRNTTDNTVPFLLLGAVFVALGPSALEAQIFFYGFTAIRLLYSFCYLKGIQPFRTISYGLGVLLTLGMIGDLCRLLFM